MKNALRKKIFKTEFGNLLIEADGFFVTRIDFTTQEQERFLLIPPLLKGEDPDEGRGRRNRTIETAAKQLQEYFTGKRKKFDVPIKLHGTDFQKKVWSALKAVPYGKAVCYEQIARKAGKPSAVRAAASAIANNKIAIVIPCHRVIRKNGQIGKYAGGSKVKKALLNLEGVTG